MHLQNSNRNDDNNMATMCIDNMIDNMATMSIDDMATVLPITWLASTKWQ